MRALLSLAAAVSLISASAGAGQFNQPGNILISDQFNNRVIEVDRATKSIVYSFGSNNPSLCNPGPGAIIGTNDVERLANGRTLMAGTGIPPGASPSMPNGCVDNRVIVVDPQGNIVWQYGQAGVTGSGPNQLNVPVFALQTPSGDYLITDQSNERVIMVEPMSKTIVFQYGTTGVSGSGPNQLNNPNSAELLSNGHILIADENNNRAIEIDSMKQIVAQFTCGGTCSGVAFASRLRNGDTLITDSNNSRIVEVNAHDKVVAQYFTNQQSGSNPNPLPSNAVRLANGTTLIADQFNHRVFMISMDGTILWQYGMLNQPGNGPNQLNGPYNAMSIGDYTGVTPPQGFN